MGDYNDAFMRNQNAAVRAAPKAQNRANVLQLKLIGQSHPTGLTANLLKLFEPRPPLDYKPPPEKRKCPPYSGMAQFVSNFAEPGDPEYAPPVPEVETSAQRRARIHQLRLEKGAEKAVEGLQSYHPNDDPNISGDPYKTLFVARLNYETTESRIKREFESYGPIKRHWWDASCDWELCDQKVRLVTDKVTNKPKGYAFIEYVHTRDMKAAYKQGDGRKIDGRRVLVDVERGRTVPNWRPRRLGGGLGTTRVGSEELNQKHSGRELQQTGGSSRSEEPRSRDERERDREKSRERGRDKERERERSRERSHDKPRDRDHREDRHHRDRDRDRDREDRHHRDRDRDRDRTRDRDRGRDRGRDHERERGRDRGRDRDRDRDRDHEKDYEVDERDRGRSRDGESEYESKHGRGRHGERNYDHGEPEDDRGWYEQGHKPADENEQRYDHYEHRRSRDRYDHDRYDQYADEDHDRYDRMDEDYNYDRGASESREREREYRSMSRDYDK